MLRIANPAYDVVFKYLMEDNKIAKLLLSDLLQEEITDLEFRPQEYSLKVISFTVYRLDFKATIKTADGTQKVVLIEVQKAKFPTDILRFRRYLGEQYASNQNFTQAENGKLNALPLITVYFLGYNLDSNPPYPVLRVRRKVTDNSTHETIDIKDEFIESLTHDCIIVQIPKLKTIRRNELEQILSLFDDDEKKQEISINEHDYPEKYQEIIRRLVKAISTEEVQQSMNLEDEVIEAFKLSERGKETIQKEFEKQLAQKQIELEHEKQRAEQKEKELEHEKKRAEKEKQRAEQKEKELEQEKQRAEQLEQEKINMIKELLAEGMSIEKVMKITNVNHKFLKKHNLL